MNNAMSNAMHKMMAIGAALAGLIGAPAIAGTELGSGGVSLVAPAANTGAVAASEQASTVRETRKPGGHTLRCWHHGRLLYEGSGFRHDLDKNANVINVPRTDGEPSTQLIDLKDGMCILSRS